MTRKLKATVIGAGSSYTPELIEGFIAKRDALNFQTIHLMDINAEKLEIVGSLARRMLLASGFTGEVVLTQDLDEAIAGSDFVFAQMRVGGMEARILDEKLPLKHGLLGQETTGIGGFMNALRTVPVMLDVARRIEALAPNAWLINFSNPSGIVAEAILNNTKVKTVGLCNCFINMHAAIAKQLGTDAFDYAYVGLNHLAWITSVEKDGEQLLGSLGKEAYAGMKNIPHADYDDALLASIPYIPSSYLRYFYMRDKMLQKCLDEEKCRGEVCVEIERNLMKEYGDPLLAHKPGDLAKRGGSLYSTVAVSVADALANDKNEYHVVNVKNNGALPFLDDDDVVEIKCLVNAKGAAPVPVIKPVNPSIIGMIQAVKAYERLTVSAAINGSREDALAALMVHPLTGDFNRAQAALDEMIEANAAYMPKGLLKND